MVLNIKKNTLKFIYKISRKILFFILDLFDNDVITDMMYRYQFSRRKINKLNGDHSDKGLSRFLYTQHIPDRYSLNLAKYRQKSNFFNFQDLEKWVADNYQNNIVDINRFFFLNLCIDLLLVNGLTGNVAEIGVYKGNSAFLLSKFARKVDGTCYLFDTFKGFDQRDLFNLDAKVESKAFADTSLDFVKNIVGEENTVYVKGYFPDSIKDFEEPDSFILVHIDCDLEKPFSAALNYFYPKIKQGGFLIMHDYSSLYWQGAEKAIDEFFEDKREFVIPIPDKSGTCVIRKI